MILPVLLLSLSMLFYLIFEKIKITGYQKKIPLRITVTGTRGKTSTVRMIASVLRQSGIRTIAKTTGSEPAYILPDGETTTLHRFGLTSILEQKKLLKLAVRNKVDCLITEIMSIQPENHLIESQKIIKPHLTAITNTYPDHLEAVTESHLSVEEIFTNDLNPNSKVFIPHEPQNKILIKAALRKGCQINQLKTGEGRKIYSEINSGAAMHQGNIDLVHGVCRSLGIADRDIISGINQTEFDLGEFKIFKLKNQNVFLVNAFGANDPKSTRSLLTKTLSIFDPVKFKTIGLLNLRSDRPARTGQWIDHFKNQKENVFYHLFVLGDHAGIFCRKIRQSKKIKVRSIPQFTRQFSNSDTGTVLFGFGNIKGPGSDFINFFKTRGVDYDH